MYDKKKELREEVWRLLEEGNVTRFPTPVRGRIPNFEGSEVAARRILGMEEFHAAEAIKVNPDYPQLEVRKGALYAEKLLIMPSPRLRSGFLVMDPTKIPKRNYGRAATIRGAFQYGAQTGLDDLPAVDLIVCGSVAVTEGGARVGKGGGYSELEYAVLWELELVEEGTPIMTTVHELQFVEDAPIEEHDFSVDLIATPMRLVKADGPRIRPRGVIWDRLSEEKIERIPILKRLRQRSSAG